jgi:hypothetical protein
VSDASSAAGLKVRLRPSGATWSAPATGPAALVSEKAAVAVFAATGSVKRTATVLVSGTWVAPAAGVVLATPGAAGASARLSVVMLPAAPAMAAAVALSVLTGSTAVMSIRPAGAPTMYRPSAPLMETSGWPAAVTTAPATGWPPRATMPLTKPSPAAVWTKA